MAIGKIHRGRCGRNAERPAAASAKSESRRGHRIPRILGHSWPVCFLSRHWKSLTPGRRWHTRWIGRQRLALVSGRDACGHRCKGLKRRELGRRRLRRGGRGRGRWGGGGRGWGGVGGGEAGGAWGVGELAGVKAEAEALREVGSEGRKERLRNALDGNKIDGAGQKAERIRGGKSRMRYFVWVGGARRFSRRALG